MRIKVNVVSYYIALFAIFGLAFGKYSLFFVLLLLTAAVINIIRSRTVRYDANSILLILFIFTYAFFSKEGLTLYNSAIFLVYFSAIQIRRDMCNPAKEYEMLCYVAALGFLIHFGITVLNNLSTGYFWTNIYLVDSVSGTALAPTHYSTMMLIPICVLFFLLFEKKHKNIVEWIYIVVASVLSFVCMVILGRRILLLTVVVLLLYTACKKNIINRNSAFKVIIFVSLIAIIWIFDVFQLRSSILESTLITRILEDGTESGRLVRMSYFISHFFEHMYGGKYIFQAVGYSHNFWLDIFDYVGIVPFLIMIIINVNFIVKAYKIQKNNLLGKGDGYLISTITIVTLIQFFTEPAYFSQIVFVWVYVILSGGAIILSKSNTIPFSSKRIN